MIQYTWHVGWVEPLRDPTLYERESLHCDRSARNDPTRMAIPGRVADRSDRDPTEP